jgi:glycosyltransferase involved in cell wall biosynthesis
MKKINILHIITGLPIGGAEKVLLDLCSNLNKETIINHVIGLNDEVDFKDDFIQNGIFVKNLNMTKDPKSFFKTAKYINEYIKEHNIEILHIHMFHPLLFAFVSKLRYPHLKVVFTSHNVNIGSRFREIITFLLKPFRDTDILFSKDMITNIYKKDSVVIPNGLDTSAYKEKLPKNKKFTFISIGVLREQKNQLFLPSTAAYLKNNGIENFEIAVVGGADASGDMRKEIYEEIKKYGVEDEINMMGSRRDIPDLLKKAHCFVMPSHFEGLPIALLEAGAAGLAVVSTPVGAIPSVVDNESGYLTGLDGFAKAMLEVITNPNEAQRRAKNLKERIEKQFSIKGMAIAHEDIYKRLLSSHI